MNRSFVRGGFRSAGNVSVVGVLPSDPAVSSAAWRRVSYKFPAAFYFSPAGLFANTTNPGPATVLRDVIAIRSGDY